MSFKKFWLCAVALLVGCPRTSTRSDLDAFETTLDSSLDLRREVGAETTDTQGDASLDLGVEAGLDVGVEAGLDLVDANAADAGPRDVCNGVDDDIDGSVDEHAALDCRMAPHALMAGCVMGRCVCNPSGVIADEASYEDCNAAWDDGCETRLGTDANCASCGDTCDPASQCRRGATGFACGPSDILDFSIPEENGEIACIVRSDHRVACRGSNIDFAITHDASDTATLGWTFVETPDPAEVVGDPLEVRVWKRRRADGREALTICIRIDREGGLAICRGDLESRLTITDRPPNRGYTYTSLVRGMWSIWDGAAIVPWDYMLLVWAGPFPLARFEETRPGTATRLAIGNMPLIVRSRAGEPWGAPRTWGERRSYLGVNDWSDSVYLRTVEAVSVPARDVDCSRDVCCLVHPEPDDHIRVGCWGRHARAADEVTWVPGLPDVVVPASESRLIELFPNDSGRIEGCIRLDGSLFCADVTTAADTVGLTSAETFHEEPTRVFDGRTPIARVDWQSMCIQHRPDWWQCWGAHDGWGHE